MSSGPCQICNRKNHTAVQCWYRFDKDFTAAPANDRPSAAYVAAPGSLLDGNWCPDSGATHHLTSDLNNLHIRNQYDGPDRIKVGNGNTLSISHIGNSSFCFNNRCFHFNNVYHVPSISTNLLSVSKFCNDNKVYFEFHSSYFLVKDQQTGKPLLRGTNKGGLYHFDDKQLPSAFISESSHVQSESFSVWHHRLDHPRLKTVNKIVSNHSLSVDNKSSIFCHACKVSKSHKLSFSPSSTIYTEPLQLIVSDLWGPAPVLSRNGFRYYLLFMDACTRYTWVYPISYKSDAFSIFVQFKTQIENLTGKKIKMFQTDNGTEYKQFTPYLQQHGVLHHFTCPHTSAQNGLA